MSIKSFAMLSSVVLIDTARMFEMVMLERAWEWAAESAG